MTNDTSRLLRVMVDFIRDGETEDIPDHDCDYELNPYKAHCQFCSDWADALSLCYPQLFKETE